MSIQSKVENYIRAVKELKKTVDELDEVYNDLHNNSTSSKYTTEFIALPEVSQAVLNRPVSVFFSEVFPNDALVLSGKDKLVHPRDSKPIEISSFDKNKMKASNNDTEKRSGVFPFKGFSMSGIYEKFKGINVGSELDKSNDNNKEDNTEKGEEDDEVSTSSESDEESEEGDDENDNEDKEVSTSGESGDKRDKIKKIVIPKDNINNSEESTHKRKKSSEVVTLDNNADYSAFSGVDPNKQPKVITIEDDGDKSKKAKKTTKPPSKTLVTKGAAKESQPEEKKIIARDPVNIAIINSPLFDFRNVENLLADGLGSGNTAFDITKIPLTSFKLDKLPYNELEIKVTESKKYSDIQLNRVLNKLLNFTWPPFKDHFEYPSIEVPDYDGWKVVNMSKKLDFPSSFEKGNILDFIQMVNNCTSDARDAVWVTNVTNLDYRVNFRHAALYLMEGFARLIDGTSADLKDVQNAKLILLNTAASWDTYEPYKPVAKYHYVRGRNKERFERQGVFNMQVIPKDNRNCHIFELVALGQRILRKTKNLTEKNDITKVLFSFRKDFNCFTKLEENLPEYETMETILLNAIVLAGIYTQHFAPERILGHDWLIQHPLVSPVAAFEDIDLNPYMLAATLTKKYIGILKCKKYIKPAEASK